MIVELPPLDPGNNNRLAPPCRRCHVRLPQASGRRRTARPLGRPHRPIPRAEDATKRSGMQRACARAIIYDFIDACRALCPPSPLALAPLASPSPLAPRPKSRPRRVPPSPRPAPPRPAPRRAPRRALPPLAAPRSAPPRPAPRCPAAPRPAPRRPRHSPGHSPGHSPSPLGRIPPTYSPMDSYGRDAGRAAALPRPMPVAPGPKGGRSKGKFAPIHEEPDCRSEFSVPRLASARQRVSIRVLRRISGKNAGAGAVSPSWSAVQAGPSGGRERRWPTPPPPRPLWPTQPPIPPTLPAPHRPPAATPLA